jgi:hypothetical protein
VLQRGISIVASEKVMAVLIAVMSLGTRENQFVEGELTLMPTATLTD